MTPEANVTLGRAGLDYGNAKATQSNELVITSARNVELAQYDALPAAFRRLIDHAPVKQQIGQVLEIVQVWGWDEGYRKICDYWEHQYQGWHRPEQQP